MTELEEGAQALLHLPVTQPEEAERLKALKVPKKARNNAMLLVAVLLDKAKKGDLPAFKEIRALAEQERGEESKKDNGELVSLINGLKEEG